MIKEYTFSSLGKGGKTKIVINDGRLTISRPGFVSKLSHGFTGEKTLLINNITAVQLKKAGMARGYIQFITPGSMEKRSGIVGGDIDENIVYFDSGFNNKKVNEDAEEIKLYIENYNLYANQNAKKTNAKNKYDELEQIKQLLDNGTITKEEFEKEKEKILNN